MAGQGELLRVVDQSVGVYGTAPTCFLSALARKPDFTIDEFTDAIGRRQLVKIRAMRYSVHTFPVNLLETAAAATRSLTRKTNPYRKRIEDRYDELVAGLEAVLADGPSPAVEIRRAIDPERELGELFNVFLGMAAAEFRIVRATTTGSWRSDRFIYALWSDWLPDCDPESIDEATARRWLVERYVAAYGPVEYGDVKWWTGWTKAETLDAIDGVDLEAEGNAMEALQGVRLLPVWDVLMVAYKTRDRLYDPSYAPLVHDRYGNATSVVMDGGRVVGQWDLGRSDDPLVIRVAPF
ncbi:MAG: crosslink repair DNA glycosylase YcaQ family protein, partial [Acidimicrobiia bacterium]|nr:crosslink repair DNA glycosylase YcaQ family protein [Acidimicrobiia bacterium]